MTHSRSCGEGGGPQRFSQQDTIFSRAGRGATPAQTPAACAHPCSAQGQDSTEHRVAVASATACSRMMRWINECAPPGVAIDASEDRERYEPEDWPAFTEVLKHHARAFGASLVGVTRVNPLWVYDSDSQGRPIALPEGVDTAVVMAVAMDRELIDKAPGPPAVAATRAGYAQMAYVSTCVALCLAELGWVGIPSGNDSALSVPLAIDAGLGEAGRHGMLITEQFGACVRLCKAFTDAPLAPDDLADRETRDHCDDCTLCADGCPVGAIPTGDMTDEGPSVSNQNGLRKWYVNPEKCHGFWRANGNSCSMCIMNCPVGAQRRG